MQITKEDTLTGNYKHVLSHKILFVKKVTGKYVVVETPDKREVVIRKEDLFDNYNKINNDKPSVNQIH
jgi:hypothetical protein